MALKAAIGIQPGFSRRWHRKTGLKAFLKAKNAYEKADSISAVQERKTKTNKYEKV